MGRNKRITKKRDPGERLYSVINNTFNGGHVFVTIIRRAKVKETFMCIVYNLLSILSMKNRGIIVVAMGR